MIMSFGDIGFINYAIRISEVMNAEIYRRASSLAAVRKMGGLSEKALKESEKLFDYAKKEGEGDSIQNIASMREYINGYLYGDEVDRAISDIKYGENCPGFFE